MSEQKYHINKNNEVKACNARKKTCRYENSDGEITHGTREQMERIAEERSEKENGGNETSGIVKNPDSIPAKGASSNNQEFSSTIHKNNSGEKKIIEVETTPEVRSALGFDAGKADPKDFDEYYMQTQDQFDKALYDFSIANDRIQRKHNKTEVDPLTKRRYYSEDQQVVLQRYLSENPDSDLSQNYKASKDQVEALKYKLETFGNVYKERGSWNRAFLATSANGHVHKNRKCSTCNKNGKRTKFEMMTNYSNSSQEDIVNDAGERACTTCYPDAPVNVLNKKTKMFTKDEEEKEKRKQELAKAKQEKAAKAIANAPTADGSPILLTKELGGTSIGGGERVKTEREARRIVADNITDNLVNSTAGSSNKINPDYLKREENGNLHILKSLAEKHDMSIREVQESIRPSVEKKLKAHNKHIANGPPVWVRDPKTEWYDKDAEYKELDYGLTDKQLDAKPSEWDF